jgi:hypothetical protein
MKNLPGNPSTQGTGPFFWIWAAVFAVVLVLGLELIDYRFSFMRGADNVHYVLLAKAIATGHGYSDIHIPGHPVHTHFPPGLPVLLSPVYYLLGYNFMCMRLLIIIVGLASVYLVRVVFEREGDRTMGIILSLLVGTNFYFLFFMKEIMAEIPYMFLSLLAVYRLENHPRGKDVGPYVILAPLLVVMAYLTKMIGVTIYIAALTVLLMRAYGTGERKPYVKKFLLFAVIGIVPLLLWTLRNSLSPGWGETYEAFFLQVDYYDQESGPLGFGSFLSRSWNNLIMFVNVFYSPFITYLDFRKMVPPIMLTLTSLFIIATVLCGLFHGLYYKRGVKDFYVLFYLAILAVWPVDTGDLTRLMVPVIPFLYFYFLAGINRFVRLAVPVNRSELLGKKLFFIPCFFFLMINIVEIRAMVWPPSVPGKVHRSMGLLSANLFKRVERVELDVMTNEYFKTEVPCYHQYLHAAHTIGEISGPGEVIMARKPGVAALVSGRHALRFPYTRDKAMMLKFIEDNGVVYILLDGCYEETENYLVPFLEENTDRFSVWMHEDNTGILKLKVE